MSQSESNKQTLSIGIVGGGIAGATAAIRLSECGFITYLFERKAGLVYGPPICHLHAGGNLYREIDQKQCRDLLRQSIDSVKMYPHTINNRPTIIAVPESDKGEADALLPRLEMLRSYYRELVELDSANRVLGEPEDYYRLYSKKELEGLRGLSQEKVKSHLDKWMVPFASNVDLNSLKYPVVLVQEYGWSLFRLAASAELVLEQNKNAHLVLGTTVTDISKQGTGWCINYSKESASCSQQVDFLINACGFESGVLDNLVNVSKQRLVEFKAAYVTCWQESQDLWPEVIFHGERGSVDGMAQLTPYADGLFQLHGMTHDVTLFTDGLVRSDDESSQPRLPDYLQRKIKEGWSEAQKLARTQKAIAHMSRFIPAFSTAKAAGTPLFGAQQIPGRDASLRSADVAFYSDNYARIEIIKGSSAIEAADKIVNHITSTNKVFNNKEINSVTLSLSAPEVESAAIALTRKRGYPEGLAKNYGEKTAAGKGA